MSRRVPLPLIALCVTAFVVGATWAFVVPPFQAPDENQHFAYADYVAQTGELPGVPGRPPFSTEQQEAGLLSNSDQTAGNIFATPSWNPQDFEAWERRDAALGEAGRRDGGGEFPATRNPRLYYLVDSLPLRAAAGSGLFTRMTWARLVSVLFTVALVVFTWLLAGQIFARDRTSQFLAAGAAGLLPMLQFVSSSVTPDAMLYAIWAAFLWVGAGILLRGLTPGSGVALVALTVAACFVKDTSYALIPAAAFAIAAGLWRLHPLGGPRAVRWIAAAAAVLGIAAIVVFLGRQPGLDLDDLRSYLWQYHLPRLPGQGEYPFPPYFEGIPFYDVVLRGVFGTFGWTEVRYPEAFYPVLTAIAAIVAAAAIAVLVRVRRALPVPLLVFFAITAVALWAGVQWTDYEQLKQSNFLKGFNQGRYLFPLAALGGVAVATAARVFPARTRPAVAAAFVQGLVLFNLYALGTVAWRFYA